MTSARLVTMFCCSVAVATAACGGGGSGGADESAWSGNWNRTGTQSTTCGAQSATTQLTGVVIIGPGPSSGTIQTTIDNCPLVWDVSGSKATLKPAQTCTVSINGFNVTVTGTQGSATLAGNIITGTEAGSSNNNCSFMQQTTLTKM